MNKRELAKMIDHTTLGVEVSGADIERVCAEAVAHGFGVVCVPPCRVRDAVKRLSGADVRVGSVAGFPHGNTLTSAKCSEAQAVVDEGALDVDMVMNVGAFKDGDFDLARRDIALVAQVVHGRQDAVLKVILETPVLSDDQIAAACELAEEAGADFVKTSTGYGTGGATVEAVRIMRATVGERLGVKAAGGIRDYDSAMAMIAAGANRIGASGSLRILEGAE